MSITFIRRADSHGDHILPISIAIHSPCNTSKQAHTHRYPFTPLSTNDNTNWYHLYLRLTHSISVSFSPWSEHDFNNVISVKSICNDLSPSKHLLVKLKNQSQYRSRKLTDYEMNLWNFSTEILRNPLDILCYNIHDHHKLNHCFQCKRFDLMIRLNVSIRRFSCLSHCLLRNCDNEVWVPYFYRNYLKN